MSALPRPDLPTGPHRELVDALHDLHHRAGWPSLRRLAAETGVSHTTVSKALSSPALPTWGTLELLVEAMGGDRPGSTSSGWPRPPRRPARVRAADRRPQGPNWPPYGATSRPAPASSSSPARPASARPSSSHRSRASTPSSQSALPAPVDEVPRLPLVDVLQAAHEVDQGQWLEEALPVSRLRPPRLLAYSRTSPRSRRTRTTRLDSDCSWPCERCSTHSDHDGRWRCSSKTCTGPTRPHWTPWSTCWPTTTPCRWWEPGELTTPAHPSRCARGGSG